MEQKVNGYTKEEAKNFVLYMQNGVRSGKRLSSLFSSYAQQTGRAKGSVRNYYYSLLKNVDDEEVKQLILNAGLKAETPQNFTDEETDRILREILKRKSQGLSVRRAVMELSGGDAKTMLRYQNKYRNVLCKQPQTLHALMQEYALPTPDEGKSAVEEQINALYDRLTQSVKAENERLTVLAKRLMDENRLLKLQIKQMQA